MSSALDLADDLVERCRRDHARAREHQHLVAEHHQRRDRPGSGTSPPVPLLLGVNLSERRRRRASRKPFVDGRRTSGTGRTRAPTSRSRSTPSFSTCWLKFSAVSATVAIRASGFESKYTWWLPHFASDPLERAVIDVKNLSKSYRVHKRAPGLGAALRSVLAAPLRDRQGRRGSVVPASARASASASSGPNGAGKTTTLKVLAGPAPPDVGRGARRRLRAAAARRRASCS